MADHAPSIPIPNSPAIVSDGARCLLALVRALARAAAREAFAAAVARKAGNTATPGDADPLDAP
jgi:hypothetical protein